MPHLRWTQFILLGAILVHLDKKFFAFFVSCKQLCYLTFATTDACTVEVINMGKQKHFLCLEFSQNLSCVYIVQVKRGVD